MWQFFDLIKKKRVYTVDYQPKQTNHLFGRLKSSEFVQASETLNFLNRLQKSYQ